MCDIIALLETHLDYQGVLHYGRFSSAINQNIERYLDLSSQIKIAKIVKGALNACPRVTPE